VTYFWPIKYKICWEKGGFGENFCFPDRKENQKLVPTFPLLLALDTEVMFGAVVVIL